MLNDDKIVQSLSKLQEEPDVDQEDGLEENDGFRTIGLFSGWNFPRDGFKGKMKVIRKGCCD
ncbi:hypothetical protein M514_08321 [Trichuris suis]|uniref:Uncharacterized protein n=1 Tax=Trichuris suis TaxID=68888 RepID=A0A085M0N4_9BILA|nr:hypothetical protein M513_08321 [Trichuris suis]KFD63413.1 hypothetical protein M514_08321 [Trichuris suis]